MTEQFLNDFSAEMKEATNEELVNIYAYLSLVVASEYSDEQIQKMLEQDLPDLKTKQDIMDLMSNVIAPEIESRNISLDEVNTEIANIQNTGTKPTITHKGKLITALATFVGVVVFGFVLGPIVSKHMFPKHKGIVMAIMAIGGGALGFFASMKFVSPQLTTIAQTMINDTNTTNE